MIYAKEIDTNLKIYCVLPVADRTLRLAVSIVYNVVHNHVHI